MNTKDASQKSKSFHGFDQKTGKCIPEEKK